MSAQDRRRWDDRHRDAEPIGPGDIGPPPELVGHLGLLPRSGRALDLACGRGAVAVWLARWGLDVWGVDVSPVAVEAARALAAAAGVASRCRFDVVDLDDGIPGDARFDLVVSRRFRDRELDEELAARLADGGVLVIVALSVVGGSPGRHRAEPGELAAAHAGLEILVHHEGDGVATLVARRPAPGDR